MTEHFVSLTITRVVGSILTGSFVENKLTKIAALFTQPLLHKQDAIQGEFLNEV